MDAYPAIVDGVCETLRVDGRETFALTERLLERRLRRIRLPIDRARLEIDNEQSVESMKASSSGSRNALWKCRYPPSADSVVSSGAMSMHRWNVGAVGAHPRLHHEAHR